MKDLHTLRRNSEFSGISALFKRAKNILKNIKEPLDGKTDISLFAEDEEKELSAMLDKAEKQCRPLAEKKKYAEALSAMLPVKPALDNFFLKVMVMDKNPQIKANRLNLVKRVTMLADNIADLSVLQ
jgi:glycyl-tRNA synthetase beta chain